MHRACSALNRSNMSCAEEISRLLYRCNGNIDLGAIMSSADYVKLADDLAADIAAGRLRPGDRLLPQRTFAYQRDIAVSTASRVYSELIRRGLAAGEV